MYCMLSTKISHVHTNVRKSFFWELDLINVLSGFSSTWLAPQWCVWKGDQENSDMMKCHNVRPYWLLSPKRSGRRSPTAATPSRLCLEPVRGPPGRPRPTGPWDPRGFWLSRFRWGLGACAFRSPTWFLSDKPEESWCPHVDGREFTDGEVCECSSPDTRDAGNISWVLGIAVSCGKPGRIFEIITFILY